MNVTACVTVGVTRDNTRVSHRTHTHTYINPLPVLISRSLATVEILFREAGFAVATDRPNHG